MAGCLFAYLVVARVGKGAGRPSAIHGSRNACAVLPSVITLQQTPTVPYILYVPRLPHAHYPIPRPTVLTPPHSPPSAAALSACATEPSCMPTQLDVPSSRFRYHCELRHLLRRTRASRSASLPSHRPCPIAADMTYTRYTIPTWTIRRHSPQRRDGRCPDALHGALTGYQLAYRRVAGFLRTYRSTAYLAVRQTVCTVKRGS